MADIKKLESLAKLVRYYILRMTTLAGSGHPTSSLSATDLMVALFFGKLRYDLDHPDNPNNDRVIFSKGHASPLLYALYVAAGVLTEKDLGGYRQFQSPLEGHPTPNFKYVEVATGSLGQGLSIGLGMALALGARYQNLPMVYVLMGDSETSEGSIWEAIQLASYYKLGNLVGIIDVNRLGQSGETMLGWDVETYKKRVEAFGWEAHIVDGHNIRKLVELFYQLPSGGKRPQMIIAKTIKGKGVSFLEDAEGWHGKVLSPEDYERAIKALEPIDHSVRGQIQLPPKIKNQKYQSVFSASRKSKIKIASQNLKVNYRIGDLIPTRKAYGEVLARLGEINPAIVALDAEVKNSTFAQVFAQKFPERFFEMFIAEQNMVGAALGLAKRGKIPFVSTFSAFLTRAFDQIRMCAYSQPNIKFVGSHSGVSIGEDGPSQMGLEDLAMFRAVFDSVILCPGDAIACAKLVEIVANTPGLFYIRITRPPTPVIYNWQEEFTIGGSKIVKSSKDDQLTIVVCGVTLPEATKAADILAEKGISVRVIDAYSIKPIDEETLKESVEETNRLLITVEDHYFEGGLGDAVLNIFAQDDKVKIYKLAVSKIPKSGKMAELLNYEGIAAENIVNKVLEVLAKFS